jgi:hypothetical protein
MTPPLIYLFRVFEKIVGCRSLGFCHYHHLLLLLYQITGAEQVGYRYLLDAFVPFDLMAWGLIERLIGFSKCWR